MRLIALGPNIQGESPMKQTNFYKLYQTSTALLLAGFMVACSPERQQSRQIGTTENQSSIIGGKAMTTDFGKQAGVVGIYDLERGGLCTGSLIHKRLVLTAGHCATANDPSKLIIFFASSLEEIAQQMKQGNREGVRKVHNYIRHEKYIDNEKMNEILNAAAGNYRDTDPKSDSFELPGMNDMALLSLEADAPVSHSISKFPTAEVLKDSFSSKSIKFVLAGYGVTKVEQNPSATKAEELYKMSGEGSLHMVEDIDFLGFLSNKTKEEFAIDASRGKGSCEGDSGGPAYLKDSKGNLYLFGVTSRGDMACSKAIIYSTVIVYSPWINSSSETLLKELSLLPKPVQ